MRGRLSPQKRLIPRPKCMRPGDRILQRSELGMHDFGELPIALPFVVERDHARFLRSDVRRRLGQFALQGRLPPQKRPIERFARIVRGSCVDRPHNGSVMRGTGIPPCHIVRAARRKLRGSGDQRKHANKRTHLVHDLEPTRSSAPTEQASPANA